MSPELRRIADRQADGGAGGVFVPINIPRSEKREISTIDYRLESTTYILLRMIFISDPGSMGAAAGCFLYRFAVRIQNPE